MRYSIEKDGELIPVEVNALSPRRYQVKVGDGPARVVDAGVHGDLVHLLDGQRSFALVSGSDDTGQHVQAQGFDQRLMVLDGRAARRRAQAGAMGGGGGVVRSPMPGRVVKVLVEDGQGVNVGDGVCIVEAMKMENELRAEVAGVVTGIHVKADDRVESNADLVTITPEEA